VFGVIKCAFGGRRYFCVTQLVVHLPQCLADVVFILLCFLCDVRDLAPGAGVRDAGSGVPAGAHLPAALQAQLDEPAGAVEPGNNCHQLLPVVDGSVGQSPEKGDQCALAAAEWLHHPLLPVADRQGAMEAGG